MCAGYPTEPRRLRTRHGTGKTFSLKALGQLAVEQGLHVAWFTLEDLRGRRLKIYRED